MKTAIDLTRPPEEIREELHNRVMTVMGASLRLSSCSQQASTFMHMIAAMIAEDGVGDDRIEPVVAAIRSGAEAALASGADFPMLNTPWKDAGEAYAGLCAHPQAKPILDGFREACESENHKPENFPDLHLALLGLCCCVAAAATAGDLISGSGLLKPESADAFDKVTEHTLSHIADKLPGLVELARKAEAGFRKNLGLEEDGACEPDATPA